MHTRTPSQKTVQESCVPATHIPTRSRFPYFANQRDKRCGKTDHWTDERQRDSIRYTLANTRTGVASLCTLHQVLLSHLCKNSQSCHLNSPTDMGIFPIAPCARCENTLSSHRSVFNTSKFNCFNFPFLCLYTALFIR